MSADTLHICATVAMAAHGRYWFRLDAGAVFWDAEGLGEGFPEGLDERQLLAIAKTAGHALAHEFACKTDNHDRADQPRSTHAAVRVLMPPEMTVGDAGRLRPLVEQAIVDGFNHGHAKRA